MDDALRHAVTDVVGSRVVHAAGLSGGDVADAYRVQLMDGRTVFAKTKADADQQFFPTEATGLSWLAEPGVIAVPEVLGVTTDPPGLVLEWIEPGHATAGIDAEFGRALAQLHRSGAPTFGRTDRASTGSLDLPNEPCDTWAEALGANRLVPLARIGLDRGAFGPDIATELERVAGRLDVLVPIEPAARLHGDLWAGNRMIGRGGKNWLIDPAAHGGHREFDLSMMALFGGFGRDCIDAYDATCPLEPGWRARIPLHQLAPLAVHAIKFGGHYGGALRQALDATD